MTKLLNETLHRLFRAIGLRENAGQGDGQLLTRFIEHRDEAAFEALVRRHGPMVWGVCRRVLRDAHHAEDAFQATFLVLVRKASAVVPREMVGNWLYGVAYHTALKARAALVKRSTRERQVAGLPDVRAGGPDPSLNLELDEELNRLPDKYRVAIVLCDLEVRWTPLSRPKNCFP